jgi:hypothetical protein
MTSCSNSRRLDQARSIGHAAATWMEEREWYGGSREFGYVLVGRQHRVRTTPVPANAAQTHQDDDNAGGRPRPALVQSMAGCASTADWRSMRGVGDVSVIGCVGSLIVATRGVAGVGEVLLNVRGTKEAYLAWSEQPLPRGTEVLVIDVRGARTVLVEPWPGSSLSTLTS